MAVGNLLKKMARPVVTAPADLSVADAIVLMGKEKVGAVIVLQEDHPVGIFSAGDCLRLCLDEKPGDFGGITLDRAMNRKLISVGPEEDIGKAMDMMLQADTGYLPVIEGGHLIGVLNARDLMMEQIKTLDDELGRIKNYIDDLHEAGRD